MSMAWRGRRPSGARRSLTASLSRTTAPSHPRPASRRGRSIPGCSRGEFSRTRRSSSPNCRPRTRKKSWERDRPDFGTPGTMDRVFFSCAACHVGRVVVGNRMTFLPGMPNTEVEAQYYSKLLMLTSAALVESGFDPSSTTPVDPAGIKPKTSAVRALYTEMLNKARLHPETLYGSSPARRRSRKAAGPGYRRGFSQRDEGSRSPSASKRISSITSWRRTTATSKRCPTSSRIVLGRWTRLASPLAWSPSIHGARTTASWTSSRRTTRTARSTRVSAKPMAFPPTCRE